MELEKMNVSKSRTFQIQVLKTRSNTHQVSSKMATYKSRHLPEMLQILNIQGLLILHTLVLTSQQQVLMHPDLNAAHKQLMKTE